MRSFLEDQQSPPRWIEIYRTGFHWKMNLHACASGATIPKEATPLYVLELGKGAMSQSTCGVSVLIFQGRLN